MAKVALRFGFAKQSKNLERYLLNISYTKMNEHFAGTTDFVCFSVYIQNLGREVIVISKKKILHGYVRNLK